MNDTNTTAPDREQPSNDLNTPWSVRHDDDDFWCVVNILGIVIYARTGGDAEAVARIIAAAPKLLEALKTLREDIRMLRDGEWVPDDDSCQASLDVADAAIAEATGDSIGRAV